MRVIPAHFPNPRFVRESDTYLHYNDFFYSWLNQQGWEVNRVSGVVPALEWIQGESAWQHDPVLDFVIRLAKDPTVKLGIWVIKDENELRAMVEDDKHGLFMDEEWKGVFGLVYPRGRFGKGKVMAGVKKGKEEGMAGKRYGIWKEEGVGRVESTKAVKPKGDGSNRFALLGEMEEDGMDL